jgi:hypothetical protein
LHLPYRLVNYRTPFEVVSWNGAHCYITAERSEDVLVFCPEMTAGRRRIIRKSDPGLVRSGAIETNLFSRFSQSASRPGLSR